MIRSYPRLTTGQPAVYRILIQGRLNDGWQDWFEGMDLTVLGVVEEGQPSSTQSTDRTILTGELPDQAALIGTLQRLYSIGMPILQVELVSIKSQ
jgi:hypothetical protein